MEKSEILVKLDSIVHDDSSILEALEEHEANFRGLMNEIADMYDYYEEHGEFKEEHIIGLKLVRDFMRAGGSE